MGGYYLRQNTIPVHAFSAVVRYNISFLCFCMEKLLFAFVTTWIYLRTVGYTLPFPSVVLLLGAVAGLCSHVM
jgi:hypothetical protein